MKTKSLLNISFAFLILTISLTCLELIQRIRHPYVGFRNMCNSIGFRSPEFNPKKQPGAIRILFIGSSTTFGTNAPVETTFPFLVGKLLIEKLPEIRTETINAAQPCKTSYWELERIKETLYLTPDIIVVMTGYNDSATIYSEFANIDEQGDLILKPSLLTRLDTWIAGHSVFYVTFREKIAILRYGSPLLAFTKPPAPQWERTLDKSNWFKHYPEHFRKNLQKMIAVCSLHKIKLIFIKAPLSPQRREEHPLYEKAYARLMKELTVTCSNQAIPLINLEYLCSNSEWRQYISPDGLHFTDEGNQKISEAIAGFFLENRKNYF